MDAKLTRRFVNAKRALFDKLYGGLNEKQREAVYSVDGPLLILAGAGSGKTTVLVNRIAHIIKYGKAWDTEALPAGFTEKDVKQLEDALSLSGEEIAEVLSTYSVDACPPWQMLAITFTNKAANEMKERIAAALNDDAMASEIWAGTFHSVCVRLLRRFGEHIGYSRDFSIYDSDDVKRLITACQKELNIDDKAFPVRATQNVISRAKDRLMDADSFENEAGSDFRLQKIAAVYKLYEKKLRAANALDFDDLIMQTVRLLREDTEAREFCQKRFRYICVDEYQDTNVAQFELVKLFSGKHGNVMVVGDDDQSIYRFRGATIENILSFDKAYEGAKVIKLEQN